MYSVRADLKNFCNILVCFPSDGQQQNAGTCDLSGQFAPALNQAFKVSAFLICELDLVLFFHSSCPLRRTT